MQMKANVAMLCRSLLRAALGFGCVVFCATTARGDVDVRLARGNRVRGSISPAGDVDRFRVELPSGCRLSVRLLARPRPGEFPGAVGLTLRNPESDIVLQVDPVPGGLEESAFLIESTGLHTLEIAGGEEVDTDYSLDLKWDGPDTVEIAGDTTPGEQIVYYPAEPGVRVRATVSAAPGSSAKPRFLRELYGLREGLPLPTGGSSAASHAVRLDPASMIGEAVADEVAVVIGNVDGAAGAFVGSIRLKPPKPSRRTIDVTVRRTAAEPGQSGASDGVLIDGAGGVVSSIVQGIAGAELTVPPGAVSLPTAFTISTSAPIRRPGRRDAPAGPTVAFGPAGAVFRTPVLVTLPADLTGLGDDLSRLVVYTQREGGRIRRVKGPFTYDAVARTVTFPVKHFSSFRPFVRGGRGLDVDGDEIDDLVVGASGWNSGAGTLRIFRGGPGVRDRALSLLSAADYAIDGSVRGDLVGDVWHVADFTGDGIVDVATALAPIPGGRPGELRIWRGGAGLAGDISNGTFVRLTPPAGERRVGDALVVGDITGDERPEIVIRTELGVYAHDGNDPLGSEVIEEAPGSGWMRLDGLAESDGDLLYLAIGDINGDGVGDLLAGTDLDGGDRLRVITSGRAMFDADDISGQITLIGSPNSSDLGRAIDVGDVDGDAANDLVVAGNTGPVHFIFGSAAMAGEVPLMPVEFPLAGSVRNVAFLRTASAGGAVERVLVVGEPDFGATDDGSMGRVSIFRLSPPDRVVPVAEIESPGDERGESFGSLLSSLDWDADGLDDLVVGAPRYRNIALDFDGEPAPLGAVRVYFDAVRRPEAGVVVASEQRFSGLGIRNVGELPLE